MEPPKTTSLSVDTNVVRAFITPGEDLHAAACSLFDLAEAGVVSLMLSSSGQIVDVTDDRAGLRTRLEKAIDDTELETSAFLSYPGVNPGGKTVPGVADRSVGVAWQQELGKWRTHLGKAPGPEDLVHVETHVVMGRDLFVTDDRGLLAMCRLLREQHAIPVDALDLQATLERLA